MACAIDMSIGDRTPTVIIFYVIELSQNVTVTNGDLRNIDRLSKSFVRQVIYEWSNR